MIYKVIILKEARFDFNESLNWYKEINPKLGNRFKDAFKESLIMIKENPFHFQIRYDKVRVILLKHFPYLIHFSIENDTIVIKAIFHSSRNSKINTFK